MNIDKPDAKPAYTIEDSTDTVPDTKESDTDLTKRYEELYHAEAKMNF